MFDFRYEISIDYSREIKGNYGRESTIHNAQVEEGISPSGFAKSFIDQFSTDNFSEYRQDLTALYALRCVGSIHEVWNPGKYQINIGKGYYGDEIRGVRHKDGNQMYNRIQKVIQDHVHYEDYTTAIYQLLEWEYGYVLDHLKDKELELVETPVGDLRTPNKHYAGKVDKIESGIQHDIPVGVYADFEVVDGYHRLATLRKSYDDDKVVWVYNFK